MTHPLADELRSWIGKVGSAEIRDGLFRRAADEIERLNGKAARSDWTVEMSELVTERDDLRRQLVALRGSQDTAWLAEVARREGAQKRLAETLVLHGVAEDQAARYREALEKIVNDYPGYQGSDVAREALRDPPTGYTTCGHVVKTEGCMQCALKPPDTKYAELTEDYRDPDLFKPS